MEMENVIKEKGVFTKHKIVSARITEDLGDWIKANKINISKLILVACKEIGYKEIE